MKKNFFISVVFSFRNEEENITELIRQVQDVLNTCAEEYELVFVDDCSTDNSSAILKNICAADKRVKVITLARRFGFNQCVVIGMKYAAGDIVITMEADLQDPPRLIPELIEKYEQGADVVHTVRTGRRGESLVKIAITTLAYKIIRWTAGIDLIENAGNYKLFSRRAADQLIKLNEREPYFRGLAVWIGFPQAQVPYMREKRFAGQTHFPILRSSGPVKEFINGMTAFSLIPLVAPLALALIGFVGWSAALTWSAFSQSLVSNLAMFLLSLGLLVVLGFLGVFGLYIHKIWNEVNNRPFCIVESTCNIDEEETTPR